MSERTIQFCPYCGSPTLIRHIAGGMRPYCPSCDWVYFSDPKVAAAVLIEQNGKILLTRRAYSPHQGKWSLPAGFVNAYEDPIRAAERECLEETGLMVKVTELLDVISGREHSRGADIIIIYRAVAVSGELLAGDDADQVEFFPQNQLPPLAFNATRKVLEQKSDS